MVRFIETTTDIPCGTYERQTFLKLRHTGHLATIGKVRGTERYTVLPALAIAETCGFGHHFDTIQDARRHVARALRGAPGFYC